MNLIEKVRETKAAKIKLYPCLSNRASALPDACTRKLVYQRTRWQEAALHDVDLQYIFDEGNHQEEIVIKDLAAAGIQVQQQQRPFEWKEYQITGHVDGFVQTESGLVPIEIKSMSPNVFKCMNSVDDLKRYSWTRKYTGQIVLYMLMGNCDKAILLLKNKSTGQLKQFDLDLNDYLDVGEELLKKAEEINKHVAAGTIPGFCDDADECMKCAFRHICMPDMKAAPGLKIIDKADLEQKLKRMEELRPAWEEYEEIKSVVDDEIKGVDNALIGDYLISGKEVVMNMKAQPAKEAFVRKYWKSKITKIAKVMGVPYAVDTAI